MAKTKAKKGKSSERPFKNTRIFNCPEGSNCHTIELVNQTPYVPLNINDYLHLIESAGIPYSTLNNDCDRDKFVAAISPLTHCMLHCGPVSKMFNDLTVRFIFNWKLIQNQGSEIVSELYKQGTLGDTLDLRGMAQEFRLDKHLNK